MIQFQIKPSTDYFLIDFKIEKDILVPEALKQLQPPDPIQNNFAHKGVILSGRGPIWLYGFLIHFYHPVKWVATFDPRLQAAVVVESHTPTVEVGDLIPYEKYL